MDYNEQARILLETLVMTKSFQGYIEEAKRLLVHKDQISEENIFFLLYNLILALNNDLKNEEIVLYSDEILDLYPLNDDINLKYRDYCKDIYFKKGQALSRIGKYFDAEKAFDQYVYLLFRVSIRMAYNQRIFTFRTVNTYSLNDLINKEITVVNPTHFNDPSDCAMFDLLDAPKFRSYNNKALKESFNKVKIRSFTLEKGFFASKKRKISPTKDYLMWSHYSDSHKGFCIEYDLSHRFPENDQSTISGFFPINYIKGKLDVSELEKISFQNAFLTKQLCWKYEEEVRLLYYDINCNDSYKCLKLDPESRIKAIYFGVKCSEDNERTIQNLLRNDGVDFYKMKKDPKNIYGLIQVKI